MWCLEKGILLRTNQRKGALNLFCLKCNAFTHTRAKTHTHLHRNPADALPHFSACHSTAGPHNNVLMPFQSAVGLRWHALTLHRPRQGGHSTTHESKQGRAVWAPCLQRPPADWQTAFPLHITWNCWRTLSDWRRGVWRSTVTPKMGRWRLDQMRWAEISVYTSVCLSMCSCANKVK